MKRSKATTRTGEKIAKQKNVIRIRLPKLRRDQREIVDHPAKVKVIRAGRRYGKTTMWMYVAICLAAAGGRVAWVVPNYQNAKDFWGTAESLLAAAEKARRVSINKNDKDIRFLFGKRGWIRIYTLDKSEGIRGSGFNLLIIDEAARIKESVYTKVLKPCLADVDGDLVLISTPRGLNWFYNEYRKGERSDQTRYKSFHRRMRDNPMPGIQRAYRELKRDLPAEDFLQECDAEFRSGGGGVFPNLKQAMRGRWACEPDPSRPCVMSIDIAQKRDACVVTIMEVNERRQVYVGEHNRENYEDLKTDVKALIDKWRPMLVTCETNQNPGFADWLERQGVPLVRFVTTNESKRIAISRLITVLNVCGIKLLPNLKQFREFTDFERKISDSGNVVYSAPDGGHDDYVMAVALANNLCWNDSQSLLTDIMKCRITPYKHEERVAFASYDDRGRCFVVYMAGTYNRPVVVKMESFPGDPRVVVDSVRQSCIIHFGIEAQKKDAFSEAWRMSGTALSIRAISVTNQRIHYEPREPDQGVRLGPLHGAINAGRLTLHREVADDPLVWRDLGNGRAVADALAGALNILKETNK